MSDQTPIDDSKGGLDRRSLIKRGAVVGGALVWTTPLVQSITSPAFGATPSGGGGNTGDPECLPGTQVLTYYFRAVVDNGVVQSPFMTDIGNGGPQCMPASYNTNLTTPADLLAQITVTVTGSSFTIGLPAGFTITEADVKVGGGNGNPDPDAPDGCFDIELASDQETASASVYDFTLPDTNDMTRGISNIYVVFSGCPRVTTAP